MHQLQHSQLKASSHGPNNPDQNTGNYNRFMIINSSVKTYLDKTEINVLTVIEAGGKLAMF